MASIWASITLGGLQVDMEIDGSGYSPDLVHDMLHQLHETFDNTLASAHALGLVIAESGDEDAEE